MSRPDSVSTDLVAQVIARKPYRGAEQAISALNEWVSYCVKSRYRGGARGDKPFGVVIGMLFSTPLVGLGYAAIASIGFPQVALACGVVGGMITLFGPFAYLAYRCTPERQFRDACKELRTAAAPLPPALTSRILNLLGQAERAFLLARVAVVQEEIAGGAGTSASRLSRLHHRGGLLIDEAAEHLRLSATERGTLRAAFNAGALAKPDLFVNAFEKECMEVRRSIWASEP